MGEEKTEIVLFEGEPYEVTPETKECVQRLLETVGKFQELIDRYGNIPLPDDIRLQLEQFVESTVAQAMKEGRFPANLAAFLKTRA
jgi:hypothetical protein